MTPFLAQFSFGLFIMAILLTLSSIFMILLILVQQGRGGGLTGALGGMGGQSAFGTKAGDLFTRITIVTAIIWILLSILTIAFFNRPLSVSEDTSTAVETGTDQTPAENPIDGGVPPLTPPGDAVPADSSDATKLTPPAEAVPQDGQPPDGQPNEPNADEKNAPPPAPSDSPAPSDDGSKQPSQPSGPPGPPTENQPPSSSDGG
jgi:preprotein translocase subunit SecG